MEQGICRNAFSNICYLSCPTVELCGISTGTKELIVGGLLANVGIGIVLPILSSSLATSLFVLISAGASPADPVQGKNFPVFPDRRLITYVESVGDCVKTSRSPFQFHWSFVFSAKVLSRIVDNRFFCPTRSLHQLCKMQEFQIKNLASVMLDR